MADGNLTPYTVGEADDLLPADFGKLAKGWAAVRHFFGAPLLLSHDFFLTANAVGESRYATPSAYGYTNYPNPLCHQPPQETPVSEAIKFENFTDRARMVMSLATQEARRQGHSHVGVQHLLLAVVKEGSGVGAHALVHCWVRARDAAPNAPAGVCQDWESGWQELISAIRRESDRLIPPGPKTDVVLGRLPFTPGLTEALRAADRVRTDPPSGKMVGTEHLLLVLFRDPESPAVRILTALGVTEAAVRAEVVELLGGKSEADPPEGLTKMKLTKMKEFSHTAANWWGNVNVVGVDPAKPVADETDAAELDAAAVKKVFDDNIERATEKVYRFKFVFGQKPEPVKGLPVPGSPWLWPDALIAVRGRYYTDAAYRATVAAASRVVRTCDVRADVAAAAEAFLLEALGGPVKPDNCTTGDE